MKRVIFRLAVLFSLITLFASLGTPVLAIGNVNNFEIQDFQIDYYLGRDSQNRSTLKTIEKIDALFPNFDQNHGIERAIPNDYDGHPTSLHIESVTSPKSDPLPFATYKSDGNTMVRIGSADSYVHGLQNYKITYTQRDVTKFFSNTNDDEFYWDTNGTEWHVPIKSVTARLHIDKPLVAELNDKQQCYFGAAGANNKCQITNIKDGFMSKVGNLGPYENMTIAVGFQPNTFAGYKMTTAQKLVFIWLALFIITIPLSLILLVWILVRRYKRSNRLSELKPIVPEYIPPKNVSVSSAGVIAGKSGRTFSAQLIDLAVRHYLKIYQTREKSLFRSAEYELEIVKDISDLKAEEQEILKDIFTDTSVGARLDLKTLKNNRSVGLKLSDNSKKLNKDITGQYALRAHNDKQSKWFKKASGIILILALLTFSPWLLVVAITSFVIALVMKPLTESGLALSRYLKGLEMYIKVAETERLRMLQSPEGAAKLDAPIDTKDKRQLIKLYERVLPYAILFGQEKGWNKQLSQYYQSANQSPSWYSGPNNTFNALAFSTAMSNFTQAASYGAASNSGTGGSGGGGSSGGGGGGGGGGGW